MKNLLSKLLSKFKLITPTLGFEHTFTWCTPCQLGWSAMALELPPDDDVGLIVPIATPSRKVASSMSLESPVGSYGDICNVFCFFICIILLNFSSEVDDCMRIFPTALLLPPRLSSKEKTAPNQRECCSKHCIQQFRDCPQRQSFLDETWYSDNSRFIIPLANN